MTDGIDRKVEAILDRYAAVDWRQPAYDPAGIHAVYQRWQAVVGVELPLRLATDPAEVGIWRSSNGDNAFAATDSDILAAAARAESWVPRFWAEVLAGRVTTHQTIDRLYPELRLASGGALPSALPIAWDVAAGWATLFFLGSLNNECIWTEASAKHIAAAGPAYLRAMNLVLPFGFFAPWGPPASVALGLRNVLAACSNMVCWRKLAQTSISQDDILAQQLLELAIPAPEKRGFPRRREILQAIITLCEPMLAACQSGALAHAVVDGELVIVVSPSIWTDGRRLHRADGPAIAWRQTKAYAWKGVFLPEKFVLQPDTITREVLRGVADARLQDALIDVYAHAYGHRRCMQELGGVVVHEDGAGRLWCIDPHHHQSRPLIGDMKLVEVVNGTSEPDGSRKTYWLRVPPWMRTAQEAVAWTYGMTPAEYDGLVVRT